MLTFGGDSVIQFQEAEAVFASELPAPAPVAFGPPARRLFGWYHAARSNQASKQAIVLCNPMGHEALCTHATYRYLAERLAAAGYPALRFDYDGTGDSCGSDEDTDRVGNWLASIGCAIDTLRHRSQTAAVSLFGVRLGATLAAVAAAERGDVEDLILWAPCRSGRNFLRELRVLRAAQRQNGPPADGQEYEEAAGFFFTRATVDSLNQLDASALIAAPTSRALIIGRDDLSDDPRLSRSLTELGTVVTQARWPGYAAMMRDAQETEVPRLAVDSVIAWLDSHSIPGLTLSPASVVPAAADHPLDSPFPATDAYTEEPLLWGTSPRTFGMLTRPRTPSRRNGAAVLLLNVGANHHIGPNRMYVALARQLAAQGFLVLRLDSPGVGDSAEGAASVRRHLYSASAAQDVQAAITHLERHLGADRFVLIGLCSGAYTAYLTAFDDPRVSTQILINPQTFEWKEGDTLEVFLRQGYYRPTRSYFTLLNSADALKRMLRQQVDVKGICQAVCQRWAVRGGVVLRSLLSVSLRREPFETQAGRKLRLIAERGADTLLIFAAEDVGLETTLLHLGTTERSLRRRRNVSLTVVEDADHTFTQKAARERMLSVIVQHLVRRYPEAGASESNDRI